MRDATVSRNYAEVLLTLARRAEDLPGWGKLIKDVASAMEDDATLRLFLQSPKVSEAQKATVLSQALSDRVPRHFLRFLLALVHKRRQMLIPEIATEFHNLVDQSEGRIHANVTVAIAPRQATAGGTGGPIALTQKLTRNNIFGTAWMNLRVFRLVGEIGRVTGGTITTYNKFDGVQPAEPRTYASVGISFGR